MQHQSIYKTFGENKNILNAWGEVMHTRVDIVLCNNAERVLKELASLIFSEIVRIERLESRFDTGSELFIVNTNASKRKVYVSEELFGILNNCVEYNAKTFGYFDITAGFEEHDADYIHAIQFNEKNREIYFNVSSI